MVGLGLGASALAASSLLHTQNVLQYVPEHVLQSTRTSALPQQISAAVGGELFTPAIDGFIRKTIASWDMYGGLSIAIVRKRTDGSGEFDVATRGYGTAALDGRPVTEDTLLPIGSNSKAFTVAAIGHLVANESVNLDWTSKVHEVFPAFEFQDDVATKYASLVDIFSHRTGLPRHDLTYRDDGKPLEEFSIRILKHLPPSAEFREATQYNNHMFNVGGSLISNLTGIKFQDFIKQHIFDAAGMSTATYQLHSAAKEGTLAEGFVRSGENTTYAGESHATVPDATEERIIAAAGGIACSAKDIAVWLQVLLNDGKSPKTGKQVIPTAVLRKMETGVNVFSPVVAPELAPVVYGLALMSSSYQGNQYIEHGGALMGYLSQITRFPYSGLGIAILTNESPRGQYALEAIRWRIAEELLGLPLRVDWNARYHFAHRAVLQLAEDEANARIPRGHDAPPPTAPLAELVGTYNSPAYGDIQAVLFQTTNNTLIHVSFHASVFLKHLDLTHYSGNTFNATLWIFMPVVDTPSGELEQEIPGILAEFDVDEESGHVLGFGISGGGALWGSGAGVPPPTGKTPRERAEAWFDRVETADVAGAARLTPGDNSQVALGD